MNTTYDLVLVTLRSGNLSGSFSRPPGTTLAS